MVAFRSGGVTKTAVEESRARCEKAGTVEAEPIHAVTNDNGSILFSEHQVPHGKHLRVHTGDHVKEGDALVVGPPVPHDILPIPCNQVVQSYPVREVLLVYHDEWTDIDPSYVSLLYEVGTGGDTGLLQGIVMWMPVMHSGPAKLMP
jgi:hypothetical protein